MIDAIHEWGDLNVQDLSNVEKNVLLNKYSIYLRYPRWRYVKLRHRGSRKPHVIGGPSCGGCGGYQGFRPRAY